MGTSWIHNPLSHNRKSYTHFSLFSCVLQQVKDEENITHTYTHTHTHTHTLTQWNWNAIQAPKKKEEILLFAMPWMDLGNVIQNEIQR